MSKPKTVQEWLDLPKDERALEFGRALRPGQPGKHNLAEVGKNNIEDVRKTGACYQSEWKCSRCKAFFPMGVDDGRYGDCSVPDPITIDQNTAKYWQGKCDRDKWYAMMEELYYAIPEDICRCPWEWVIFDAQPKHYLIAAARLKGKKNETMQRL